MLAAFKNIIKSNTAPNKTAKSTALRGPEKKQQNNYITAKGNIRYFEQSNHVPFKKMRHSLMSRKSQSYSLSPKQ